MDEYENQRLRVGSEHIEEIGKQILWMDEMDECENEKLLTSDEESLLPASNETIKSEETARPRKRLLGILCGALSGILNSAKQIIAKLLLPLVGLPQILLGSNIFHLPLNILLLVSFKEPFLPDASEKFYVLYKLISDVLSIVATYASLMYIPYIDAIVVYYGSFIISFTILSNIFLKERITCVTLCLVVLMLVAVIITCKPMLIFNVGNVKFSSIIGYMWSVAAGIFDSMNGHASSFLVKTSSLTSSLYVAILGIVIGSVVWVIPIIPNTMTWSPYVLTYLFVLGMASLGLNVSWSFGLQVGKYSEVSMASQVDIPSGLVLQAILISIMPNVHEIIGASLVVLVVCLFSVQDSIYNKIRSFCSSGIDEHSIN